MDCYGNKTATKDWTPTPREEELEHIILDACHFLQLEADRQITRDAYERWRDQWLKRVSYSFEGLSEYVHLSKIVTLVT
jgi:hypothetical protein